MKKIFLILIIITLLTGCSSSNGVNSNLCVDSDGDGNYSCYEYPEEPDYGPEDGWRY